MSSLKAFISYCHADKEHLDKLQKHLITLKTKGLIDDWSDKELIAGDNLDDVIKEHLLTAEFAIFLVSVDFLNSWYCTKVELQTALQQSERTRIIPIIVRPCKWRDTIFSKYLTANHDGKPISESADPDTAWVDVVTAIEQAIHDYNIASLSSQITTSNKFPISKKFSEYLNDTEVVFQNKFKDNILLEDIFVYPDLKNLKEEYNEIETIINSQQLQNKLDDYKKLLILGNEQSGKTSFAKMMFNFLHKSGNIPLLLRGIDIDTANVEKLIAKSVSNQYDSLSAESLHSEKNKVLIIDDYHTLKVNLRYHNKLLQNLHNIFETIILFADTSLKFDEQRLLELSDYSQFEILLFGNLRKHELIEKWNSVGREETVDLKDLQRHSDEMARHVYSIIRKNILPSKPIYVLTIIQLLETGKQSDYSLTSYGHCYQSLILTALKNSKIPITDFDQYINYLSELAYYVFRSGEESIDNRMLEDFKIEYSEKYILRSHEEIISTLINSGILKYSDESLRFRYRYIFYFYAAKYLADHINVEACKEDIRRLFDFLHTERSANILIFLVHHTKDQQVIDSILNRALKIFESFSSATLDLSDTSYLIDYIASIPQLVIEQRNVEKERKKQLEIKDRYENREEEKHDGKLADDDNTEPNKQEIITDINRSVRLVEIIGQILRNRYGSLPKNQLTDLTKSAYSSGLKFLKFFLTSTQNNQEHINKYIRQIFQKNTKFTDDEITKQTRKIFLMLCYGTCFSVIKKIANSVGSQQLVTIFKELSDSSPRSPAFQLIHIAIQLEFMKTIPKKEIESAFKQLEGNPITKRLLQELVIQHLYLNYVDYADRQWISNKLNVPMETQRILQDKALKAGG